MSKLQFIDKLKGCKNVKVSMYNNLVDEDDIKYKFLILTDLQSISESLYNIIRRIYKDSNIIGFFDRNQIIAGNKDWLSGKDIAYHLTLQEIIEKGYINPFQGKTKLFNFVEKLLVNLGFVNANNKDVIITEKGIERPDFVINNKDNKIIIEVKNYRSKYVSNNIINRAVNQLSYNMHSIQNQTINSILIVSCYVSEEVKQYCYKEKEVLILDISNLLYLSQNDKELMRILTETISYDIYPITPIKPIDLRLFCSYEKSEFKEEETVTSQAINFIKQLQDISPGNSDKNDKKYQDLCVKIIKFLFESEFTKVSEQDTTEDKMFRRDLLCGIKGSSEFWKILIQHYNSRFIVFEFKNYEEEINQNLVYITGKYLYNAALRNVAIIISRKGFSYNAHKLSLGMLIGEEKLIIDLNDDDIITMLRMKADEQEPSDYLLNKLEDFLMSISK